MRPSRAAAPAPPPAAGVAAAAPAEGVRRRKKHPRARSGGQSRGRRPWSCSPPCSGHHHPALTTPRGVKGRARRRGRQSRHPRVRCPHTPPAPRRRWHQSGWSTRAPHRRGCPREGRRHTRAAATHRARRTAGNGPPRSPPTPARPLAAPATRRPASTESAPPLTTTLPMANGQLLDRRHRSRAVACWTVADAHPWRAAPTAFAGAPHPRSRAHRAAHDRKPQHHRRRRCRRRRQRRRRRRRRRRKRQRTRRKRLRLSWPAALARSGSPAFVCWSWCPSPWQTAGSASRARSRCPRSPSARSGPGAAPPPGAGAP